MCSWTCLVIAIASVWHAHSVHARPDPELCNVPVRTEAGWVCGLTRWAENGAIYASFRGVPYAKQPLGELRFKELQPLEPWEHLYDATNEGPICPQTDVLYGNIMQPQDMSESCIHANIHVPFKDLPELGSVRPSRELRPPYEAGASDKHSSDSGTGLPILVFVHGGGFSFGSGDADLHGPEYLVSRRVIVITFNYRLNAFGFLSLNSSSIPGNNGLRDIVTLLRWVQRNARAFGGDPAKVTLAGQSAGAAAAHLVSLSDTTKGLFNRLILLSGTGIRSFYTTSPLYALQVAGMFLNILGINSTDPEYIHQQLIEVPMEKIVEANYAIIEQFGLTSFTPVVESPHDGITPILDNDPETLIRQGRGKDYPLLIGFTDRECETFRRRFEQFDIIDKIKENPLILVPLDVVYSVPVEVSSDAAKSVIQRYFNESINMDDLVKYSSESYFQYPAIKLAEKRTETESAPVFMYQFSYEGDHSVFKEAKNLSFDGAGHIEDLTYIFRVNSKLGTHSSFPPQNKDDSMKIWMTLFVTNFMRCSQPVCDKNDMAEWPPVARDSIQYQDIRAPLLYHYTELTKEQRGMVEFFDKLYSKGSNVITIK